MREPARVFAKQATSTPTPATAKSNYRSTASSAKSRKAWLAALHNSARRHLSNGYLTHVDVELQSGVDSNPDRLPAPDQSGGMHSRPVVAPEAAKSREA